MANLNFVVSPMGGGGIDVALVLAIKLRNNGVITSMPSEIPEEDANNVILKRISPFGVFQMFWLLILRDLIGSIIIIKTKFLLTFH